MKTIGGSLLTHFRQSSTSVANLVKITRKDGEVYGFTNHDRTIKYLGIKYETGPAATDLSDLTHTAGLNPDNAEVEGAINDTITEDQIEAGLWSSSTFVVARVNWANLAQGHEILGTGELGQVSHDGRRLKIEFMGRLHKLGRVVTRACLPSCDADLGDERCGVDIEPLAVTETVTAVEDHRNFTASGVASPDQYHTYGKLLWLTGANAGRWEETKEQLAGGVFELQLGMYYGIAVGDTFKAYPGCNKLLRTGLDEFLGDCKVKFNNVIRFRGFDLLPGIDKMLKPAGR